jgi:hypothetical protein
VHFRGEALRPRCLRRYFRYVIALVSRLDSSVDVLLKILIDAIQSTAYGEMAPALPLRVYEYPSTPTQLSHSVRLGMKSARV